MKKKHLIFGLSAAALVAVGATGLASCGAPTGPTVDIDFTLDTRGTEITFWTGFGAAVSEHLEDIIANFTEQTGINVVYETKGGYDGLAQAINLSASARTFPNITVGYPDHFASYVSSDIILQLDGYIAKDKEIPATRTDEDGTVFEELPAFDYANFYSDYTKENESIEYDQNGKGYILGIPFNKSTEVMVYNKTFFDSKAAKDANIKVPVTWDEVLEQGNKIRDYVRTKGVYGKVLGDKGGVYDDETAMSAAGEKMILDFRAVAEADFYPLSYDSQSNFFITAVRQWGGEYTEVDKETGKGYIKFNNAQTVEALTDLKELYDAHVLGIPATFGESSYCSNAYKINKSLLNIGSSAGAYNNIAPGDKFESSATAIPYKDEDHKYVISQGTNLCLLDKGTEVERLASWKLLKYLSQVANGEFAARTAYFPSCKSATESEEYQSFLNDAATDSKDKMNKDSAKVNVDIYGAENSGWNKFVDPGFTGSSTVRNSVNSITGRVFIDGAAPQDVINEQYAALADYVKA